MHIFCFALRRVNFSGSSTPVQLGGGDLPLPAGQVLRRELRLGRQERAVRPQGGRLQAVVDVAGARRLWSRPPRRQHRRLRAVLRAADQRQARLRDGPARVPVHQHLLLVHPAQHARADQRRRLVGQNLKGINCYLKN
jgi:hypothetical protein